MEILIIHLTYGACGIVGTPLRWSRPWACCESSTTSGSPAWGGDQRVPVPHHFRRRRRARVFLPLRLGTSPGRLRLTIAARGFHDSVIPASLINPYQFGYASGPFQGAVRRWITCGPAVSGPHVAMRGTCGPHLRLGPGHHPLLLQAGVEEALGHVVTFRILDSETFPLDIVEEARSGVLGYAERPSPVDHDCAAGDLIARSPG